MKLKGKIFVAGHRGMVGSAIVRQLKKQGIAEENIIVRTRSELDLLNQSTVQALFENEDITQVYIAAAKVGGIYANNTFPADFIYNNIMIQANIIDAAFKNGVKKLLFLGSSCIYPKHADQPMSEDALLTGTLEPTNEPYAIAKITGIKMCESYNRQYGETHGIDYRSVMPTNLYGLGDNYHPEHSHVIPGLIHRFHQAKLAGAESVTIWGDGSPLREFLFADDMAEASIYVMNLDKAIFDKNTEPMLSHINIGYGSDISIKETAETIARVVNFKGKIECDTSKPNGSPRKLMDSSRLKSLGWEAKTDLESGLKQAYKDYLSKKKD